jgi:hypothetical protein
VYSSDISIYLPVYLSLHLSIFQSICLSVYLSVCLSTYLWFHSPCGPWPLFQFLDLCTVRRTPWTGDQPVARPLPTHRIAQTQNKRTQTYKPQVGFEPTIPVVERSKTVLALDRAATVIGTSVAYTYEMSSLQFVLFTHPSILSRYKTIITKLIAVHIWLCTVRNYVLLYFVKGRTLLEDPIVDWRTILKLILRK